MCWHFNNVICKQFSLTLSPSATRRKELRSLWQPVRKLEGTICSFIRFCHTVVLARSCRSQHISNTFWKKRYRVKGYWKHTLWLWNSNIRMISMGQPFECTAGASQIKWQTWVRCQLQCNYNALEKLIECFFFCCTLVQSLHHALQFCSQ